MLKNTVIYCENNSFVKKQLHKIKINGLIKKCKAIKQQLKSIGQLSKEDKYINIVMLLNKIENQENAYMMIKGYNKDGSLKPMIKYKLHEDKVQEMKMNVKMEIATIDLYEKNIHIYNYQKDESYITGYMVRSEKNNKNSFNIIFTNIKVQVLLKNCNTYHEYSDMDTFIDRYYM
jgi:hypothetical protein